MGAEDVQDRRRQRRTAEIGGVRVSVLVWCFSPTAPMPDSEVCRGGACA